MRGFPVAGGLIVVSCAGVTHLRKVGNVESLRLDQSRVTNQGLRAAAEEALRTTNPSQKVKQ
jgi:hypothetical protein